MKTSTIIGGSLILAIAAIFFCGVRINKIYKTNKEEALKLEIKEKEEKEAEALAFSKRLKAKADTALLYAKANDLNLDYAFLVDFSVHSGKDRFFVWNYKKNGVIYSSMCAHGIENEKNRSTHSKIKFSNVEGSYCSSLGKYKVGARSYSNWGINVHYKLHGLEKTNSNAFKRVVVLHSHSPIPDDEIYPSHLPLGYSQGCPVINDDVMKKVDELLKKQTKPVVLWVYI